MKEILKILPHRFPFLLIDKILKFKKEKYITTIKNVSFNEPYFQGHFLKEPILPGVLILESMAQSAAILAFKSIEKKIYYLVSIKKVKFKNLVKPGDQMIIKMQFIKRRFNFIIFNGTASVNKNIVCQAYMIIRSVN